MRANATVPPAVLPASPLSSGFLRVPEESLLESRLAARTGGGTFQREWAAIVPLVVFLLLALPLLAQKTHEFCAPCHAEQVTDFQTHKHFQKGLSCDACHGPSVKHRTSTGAVSPDRVAAPDEVPALCGGCHAAEQKEYLESKHGKLVMARSKVRAANCTTCHGVHNLRTAAQTQQQCQRCHATLPSAHPAVAAAVSCMSCHAKHTLLAKPK